MRASAHLPETLKDAGYREVAEPGQTAFCRAYGTELGFFNYVNKHAEMSKRFNDAMAGTMNLSYETGYAWNLPPPSPNPLTFGSAPSWMSSLSIALPSTETRSSTSEAERAT